MSGIWLTSGLAADVGHRYHDRKSQQIFVPSPMTVSPMTVSPFSDVAPRPRLPLRRAVPGLGLALAGAGMLVVAQGQPAWLGGHVGPGLMAQLLGAGVIGLGLAWALWRALRPDPAVNTGCEKGDASDAKRFGGPALMGAVLLFALALPVAGLVVAAGLAAAPAAWGAGERRAGVLALTVAALAGLVAAIGLALLPPTAPLWPFFARRF
jgi:hypothetical protein